MKALTIKNLEKTYPGGFRALKGIDLEVEEGDFFALLGPNGAGKSTTIGIIATLVNKSAGSVKIFDHDITMAPTQAKACLGLVPQELNFNQFEKVIDIVVNQGGFYGLSRNQATLRAESILEQLDLWGKRNEVSRNLSGGMKRRLMIARALIHQPKILILDEPTAGVDIELRRSTWEFLKKMNAAGTTIILTTHYLEEAESLCQGIAIINHGEIVTRTTVKHLLNQMKTETVILDCREVVKQVPSIEHCQLVLTDPHTLEVSFCDKTTLNHVFTVLGQHQIEVISMRNKSNRLEELFIQLIHTPGLTGEAS